jgi:hypothetical protein
VRFLLRHISPPVLFSLVPDSAAFRYLYINKCASAFGPVTPIDLSRLLGSRAVRFGSSLPFCISQKDEKSPSLLPAFLTFPQPTPEEEIGNNKKESILVSLKCAPISTRQLCAPLTARQ